MAWGGEVGRKWRSRGIDIRLYVLVLVGHRLARKLDNSQGAQNKLVKIRTMQNNMLMAEMNKLRRCVLAATKTWTDAR
jgi:hypothetical protein